MTDWNILSQILIGISIWIDFLMPYRRRAGWRIFCILFVLFCQWYPKPQKKSNFLSLRVPRGRGWQCTRHSLHTPVPLSFRQWAAGSDSRMQCLLTRPLPTRGAKYVSHRALRPQSGTHCFPGQVHERASQNRARLAFVFIKHIQFHF